MILRPLPTSVHSNTQQLALQVWTQLGKIQKWLSGRVIFEIILKKGFFRKLLLKADYLIPCIIA